MSSGGLKLGPVQGADITVSDGLKPGELVIVEGIQKVRPGEAVTATPTVHRRDLRHFHRETASRVRRFGRDGARRPHRAHPNSGRAISGHCPAAGHGHDDLSWRERDNGRSERRRADRGAGQRRRQSDLHDIDQRQRRQLHADRQLRGRQRSEYRRGQRPEPGQSRAGPVAGGSQSAGIDHPPALIGAAPSGRILLAEPNPGLALPQ